MSDGSDPLGAKGQDIKARLRQMTQPLVDSLDSRLSSQVDRRVDDRIDQVLRDRLAILERAVADLDRSVRELRSRLDG